MAEIYISKLNTCIIFHVLAVVDLRDRMAEERVLERKDTQHYQPMDYVGNHFICAICHIYSHLSKYHALSFSKRVWVRKEGVAPTPLNLNLKMDMSPIEFKFEFGNGLSISLMESKEVENTHK
jgi:hypothetical protein